MKSAYGSPCTTYKLGHLIAEKIKVLRYKTDKLFSEKSTGIWSYRHSDEFPSFDPDVAIFPIMSTWPGPYAIKLFTAIIILLIC